MPTEPNATLREISTRFVAWGLITDVDRDLALTEEGDPADRPGEYDWAEIVETLGVGVGVSNDDVDDLEEAYQDLLEDLAALSDRTVSEVELGEDEDGEELLTFVLDGEEYGWEVEHIAPGQLDMLSIWECVGDLEPDDGRVFFHTRGDVDGEWSESLYVLATPAQVTALREEYGLELDPV
ncbi:hypothetical protein [Phytomonospora endophytica]|uniref:Uncharacterized protein n=1 Tax=Phytomonospora endophytica TaxID=714109 RepID=A0A841FH25_9ACTN|nr:hypothetical protein [Phytomonospora endophytica]MBB6035174.1 hypothetical protein [Phytomonospora endophytica]GIG64077.1 hypothetical protein Pen01_03720 [Phytomonospora endophytica]